MNLLQKIKSCIMEYIDIILILVVVFLCEIAVRSMVGGTVGKLPILFDLLFLVPMSAVLIFFNKKIRSIFGLIFTFFVSIYCFCQTLHYAFFSTFFSFKKITVIGEAMDVMNEAIYKIKPSFLVFLIPIILYLVYFIKIKKFTVENTLSIKTKLAIAILLLCITFVGNQSVKKLLLNRNQTEGWLSDYYLLDTFHNKVRFFDRFGVIKYIQKDTQITINLFKETETLTEEESASIDDFIQRHSKIETNDMTGIYKGKNLILISAESLNNYAISAELTPTLYKMANEGMYFTNYYAPVYQSATADSEFIGLTSMIPSVNYGTTSYTFHNNSYPYALAYLFKHQGYHSNSYHSYITNFYNRELFHSSLGFTTFYDENKLGLIRPGWFTEFTNWHKDELLFGAMMDKTSFDSKPFFNFVITANGHMPYTKERVESAERLEEINQSNYRDLDMETKMYLATQMNLDEGLERLLHDLEVNEELEDTIIMIYGDHYPYGVSTEEGIKNVIGEDTVHKYRVPFIIYDPTSTEGKQINTLGSTFDVYPTICNLFGLDYTGGYVTGRDLFSDKDGFVPFMDYSVLTDSFYYNANSNTIEVLSETYNESNKDNILKDVREIFDFSQRILKSNYYFR